MATEYNSLTVGPGEIKVSRQPQEILVIYGLGSCVGVGMYDPVARAGGLLHAALPKRRSDMEALPTHYVDTGITELLSALDKMGAQRSRLIVQMAGGAQTLVTPNYDIGEQNARAARATLAAHNLKLAAEETGGSIGRTMRLYIADGRMTVRAFQV